MCRLQDSCCYYSVAKLCPTFLWPHGHQAPVSMGFPRQDYWCGLPFTSPGYLPDRGIKPMSPAFPALGGRLFTTETPGKPKIQDRGCTKWENLLWYAGNLWFPLIRQRYIKRFPHTHTSFLRRKEFPRIWNLYFDWLWQKNQSIQKLLINSALYVKTLLGKNQR